MKIPVYQNIKDFLPDEIGILYLRERYKIKRFELYINTDFKLSISNLKNYGIDTESGFVYINGKRIKIKDLEKFGYTLIN